MTDPQKLLPPGREPAEVLTVERYADGYYTVRLGGRLADHLAFDEALAAAAVWICEGRKGVPFLRTPEEHAAFDRWLTKPAGGGQ